MPCRICFKVASGMDSASFWTRRAASCSSARATCSTCPPAPTSSPAARARLSTTRRSATSSSSCAKSPARASSASSSRSAKGQPTRNASSQSAEQLLREPPAAQEDPLFHRAVEIVLETRRGSVSLLQRRLAIGYTRASRLIDLMGIAGIISDHKGSVARDVLVGADEWEAMKQFAASPSPPSPPRPHPIRSMLRPAPRRTSPPRLRQRKPTRTRPTTHPSSPPTPRPGPPEPAATSALASPRGPAGTPGLFNWPRPATPPGHSGTPEASNPGAWGRNIPTPGLD
jgi:hypothetical protein